MNDKVYITEALEKLNKMPRMNNSRKPLKENTSRDIRIATSDIAEELDRIFADKFGRSVDIAEDPEKGTIRVSIDGVDTSWTVSTRIVYQYVLSESLLGEMVVSGEAGNRDEFIGDSIETIVLNYR